MRNHWLVDGKDTQWLVDSKIPNRLVDGRTLAPGSISTQPPLWHLHPLPCRARSKSGATRHAKHHVIYNISFPYIDGDKEMYDILQVFLKGRRKSVFLENNGK